jgi:DNA-binding IclR family transcriptional regulator
VSELSSLEKGLVILRELAASERGLSAAELAQVTGLNRTTIYRLCDILRRGDWLQRVGEEADTSRIDLGPAMHGLAVLVTSKYDTEAKLRPIVDGLAHSLGETVHVGVLEQSQVVHVARALPDSGLNMAARIGSREPAHAAGLGKALLATLSDEDVLRRYSDEELLTRTPNTIGSRTELLQNLATIRERGYATDDEESGVGVMCIAAPVFAPNGQALFAVSVTSMPQRFEGDRFDQILQAVQGAASLATAAFGGRPPLWWRQSAAA